MVRISLEADYETLNLTVPHPASRDTVVNYGGGEFIQEMSL